MDLSSIIISDKSDPLCINQFFEYYDQVVAEDTFYVEQMLEKLENQEVHWDQPWYQRCKTTLIIKPHIKLEYSDDECTNNSTFLTSKFTLDEKEILKKNWEELIQTYDLQNEPERIARFKFKKDCNVNKKSLSKLRYYFTAWLARGLNRTLQQVYTNFIKMYAYEKTGAYSAEEITVIDLVLKYGPNIDKCVSVLAVVLGRQERHIRNRISIATNGKEEAIEKKPWTLENATKLVRKLLKYTGLNLNELKNREIKFEIWKKMEKSMMNKAINLHHFWYRTLHVQLFAKENLKKYSIYKKIVKLLLASKWRSWTDIDWQSLVQHFPDGVTRLFLYEVLSFHLRYKVDFKAPLEKILECAIQARNSLNKTTTIRRLSYCPEKGLFEVT